MKIRIIAFIQKILGLFLANPVILHGKTTGYSLVRSQKAKLISGKYTNVMYPCDIFNVNLGDYSYIAKNSSISNTNIGKFCSIGPNFCCGLGIHPINGISTAPMFYSTHCQNGFSLCDKNKISESKQIVIGHDVFIGANVTVLDGIIIGNGAIIGAGAVVTKDVLPYAIVTGVPAKILRFRFNEEQISKLLQIQWWNLKETELLDIEKYFYNVDLLIKKYSHTTHK